MQKGTILYEAILARRSVRRYDDRPLDEDTLARVEEIISSVRPLVPGNEFHADLLNVTPGTDLVSALGGYGRVVNPPHYLVPYVLGQEHPLTDAGYRVEQISVRMAELGIGSCFIGALSREAEVRAFHHLPDDARIGAFLVFGWPSEALGGRAANRLLRLAAGASRKLAPRDIFFEEDFDHPAAPPQHIVPLIEAARHAPSAVNAQPWRFLWLGGRLHLFATTTSRRYGPGLGKEYRFHDAGAAMANVALVMEVLGLKGGWTLVDKAEFPLPDLPKNLQPLAILTLDDD
jgi:nitroreductase